MAAARFARFGDTDFTVARLVGRANIDLANGLGNLVNRTLTIVNKYRDAHVSPPGPSHTATEPLRSACDRLPDLIDEALDRFDFRAALDAAWSVIDEGNRLVAAQRPWELARLEDTGDQQAAGQLDAVLSALVHACRQVATELEPFIPTGAERLLAQLGSGDRVNRPEPAFPRLELPDAPMV